MLDELKGWMTAADAADRLGVKPATLYAYVSRGVLARRRSPTGQSLFDPAEIERLTRARPPAAAAGRGRGRRSSHGSPRSAPTGRSTAGGMRLNWPVHIGSRRWRSSCGRAWRRTWTHRPARRGGRLGPRGRAGGGDTGRRPAPDRGTGWPRADAPADGGGAGTRVAAAGRRVGGAAGGWPPARRRSPGCRPACCRSNGSRSIVPALAAADPLRSNLDPAAVVEVARALIAGMVDSLPGPSVPGGIAARLWAKLAPPDADPALIGALEAALVLLADHELAASTTAARVAASVRADPYAVVMTGLGATSGVLHGGASLGAESLLAEAHDPAHAARGRRAAVAARRAHPRLRSHGLQGRRRAGHHAARPGAGRGGRRPHGRSRTR